MTVTVTGQFADDSYRADGGERMTQPTVFHQVVAFGALAENTAATLKRGMTVTVTGQLADDSYSPDGSDRITRRHRLEAADIAVSLRWATATVTRQTRDQAPAPAGAADLSEAAESVDDSQLATG